MKPVTSITHRLVKLQAFCNALFVDKLQIWAR